MRRSWSTLKKLIFSKMFINGSGGAEVWETASGSIVTFDAVATPLRQLSVAVEPVQNLNGYDNPWPAGGGKNKANFPVNVSLPYSSTMTTVFDAGEDITVDSLVLSFFLENALFSNGAGAICDFKKNDGTHQYRVGGSYGIATGQTYTGRYSHAESNITFRYLNVYMGADYIHFTSGKASIQLELNTSTPTNFAPYSNICPITGWDSVTVNRTGKNLLDISLANRTLVTTGDYGNTSPRAFDKPYLYVGISMNNYFRNENIVSYSVGEKTVTVNTRQTAYGLGYTVPVKPGTAYTLSYKNKAITTMGIGYYDADGNYLGFNNINTETNWTFSTPTNCHNITVVFRPEQGSDFTYEEPQLELGSTATAYEPYNGNEYTIQLGETVYGGTLDVVNGKMTVDRYYLHVDAVKSTWGASNGFVRCYRYMTGYDAAFNTPLGSGGIGICNMLTYYSNMYNRNAEGVGLTSGANGYFSIALTTERLNLSGSETSAEMLTAMNAWLLDNPLYILYPLATPFEITLTPEQISTLQGTNNVWSDAGDVTVEYRAQ